MIRFENFSHSWSNGKRAALQKPMHYLNPLSNAFQYRYDISIAIYLLLYNVVPYTLFRSNIEEEVTFYYTARHLNEY